MGHLRLSTLLVVINVGLLLLAVAGVAIVAVRLLERLADEQALARVAQASSTAQQAVEHAGEGALASARLLAERPTLLRLLRADDRASLTPFLEQFGRTSQLDGCAVLVDGQVIAYGGVALPWDQIAIEPGEGRFLYRQKSGPLALGAWAAVPESAGRACAGDDAAGRLVRTAAWRRGRAAGDDRRSAGRAAGRQRCAGAGTDDRGAGCLLAMTIVDSIGRRCPWMHLLARLWA